MRFSNYPINTLIVDDSSEFRSLLKNHLRHLGISTISEASSGKRLLDVIEREKPDLVFLDINMPEVSGLDILPSIKQRFPKLYIIIISGESAERIVKGAMDIGVDGYVLKPFSSKIVSETLDAFVKSKIKRSLVSCYILDDEPLAMDLLEAELKKLGGAVKKYIDSPDFFDALKKRLPDIVFLDIQMPEMDGFEILMKVKDFYPSQYVVMVSGDSNIENVKKAIDLKADGYLVKPVNPKKLDESLNNFRNAVTK